MALKMAAELTAFMAAALHDCMEAQAMLQPVPTSAMTQPKGRVTFEAAVVVRTLVVEIVVRVVVALEVAVVVVRVVAEQESNLETASEDQHKHNTSAVLAISGC
jgi:hypothetical protein